MFKAIQRRIEEHKEKDNAFQLLDSNEKGFLVLKDLQNRLPRHFNITVRSNEVIALFKEMDQDRQGIILLADFLHFMQKDYDEQLRQLAERQQVDNIQFELFDHIIKVLKQKNMSLVEVFD